MIGYQEMLLEQLDIAIRNAGSEEAAEKLLDRLPQIYSDLSDEFATMLLKGVKDFAQREGLASARLIAREFGERNYSRWASGFDLLEVLVGSCLEMGDLSNRLYNDQPEKERSTLYGILFRLHAKACLIAQEIICLMKSGYPDGAMGRWRALHEVNVIAQFLLSRGDSVAQMFLDHEIVDSYKGALQHNEYEPRLQVQPIDAEDLAALKRQFEFVVNKYGNTFKKEYGWAAVHMGTDWTTFAQIEKEVDLDHWRPYYKWASQSIHASMKSLNRSLGTSEAVEDVMLAGPSNSGMTDPAHMTAISLYHITAGLLSLFDTIDATVAMKVLGTLTDEVGEEFLRISKLPPVENDAKDSAN